MQIYTGIARGRDLDTVKEYGLGIMLSTIGRNDRFIDKELAAVPLALDNGRFGGTRSNGRIWNPLRFLHTYERCVELGFDLDFVVMPDIVGGGLSSLECSVLWARYLMPGPGLALVVQDGMTPADVEPHLGLFDVIFVSGSVPWPGKPQWIDLARKYRKRCHFGKVSTAAQLREAERMGAHSVDSASFQRNKSWEILDEFRKPTQAHLFPSP